MLKKCSKIRIIDNYFRVRFETENYIVYLGIDIYGRMYINKSKYKNTSEVESDNLKFLF